MKLIKQTRLFFQEGKSDKVYEVDLCEVADDQFLVNFRYGRRGSTLRDGTKTTSPVSRSEAESIFDSLVDSKEKKGYSESEATTAEMVTGVKQVTKTEEVVVDAELVSTPMNPQKLGVISRLKSAFVEDKRWKLSRAIWRAGELGIVEAEPLLHDLTGHDDMTDYCICWSLGRLGQQASIPVLQKIGASSSAAHHVADMAQEAIRSCADDETIDRLTGEAMTALPPPLNSFVENSNPDLFEQTFLDGLGKQFEPNALSTLYYIDNEVTRPTLLKALETVPLEPGYFRIIRRMFKVSEMRRDGQVFGLLAYRFEKHKSKFRVPDYHYRGYVKPTLGDNPEHAFSTQTRGYFNRRVWNTLKRLGDASDNRFVPMAVGTLLPFTDDDALPVRSDSRYQWDSRSYTHIHWDVFGSYWALNQLLYNNSKRYVPLRGGKSFRVADGFEPGSPYPDTNEAAYPDLWQAQPRGLLHLLTDSKCRPVHEFAARAIRNCKSFCAKLELDVIKIFLASAYEITVELGFDLAVERYDDNNPDLKLVSLVANCPLEKARRKAKSWIEYDCALFFADTDFACSIFASQFADTRAIAADSIFVLPNDDANKSVLAAKLIAFWQGASPLDVEIVNDVGNALLNLHFQQQIGSLGEEVICDLLKSEVAEVQRFAASVVLSHLTLSRAPTERVLRTMLDATDQLVRAKAIKLISQLSDSVLTNNVAMLAGLCCHELEDIREEVRPVVSRLVASNSAFAGEMATELIRRLLIPGAPQGVPSHTSKILREDFANYMKHISSETVWKLLQSRSAPAQEVGGFLLPTNVSPSALAVSELVKLSYHDVLTVREASWKYFESELSRIQSELPTAVRILDSSWEDSRQFGFQFFKANLNESEFTADVLVSICDSTRDDVQQFGREMITRQFDKQDGPLYLTRLSEHPSAELQKFATGFLVEYGSDSPDRLAELTPYFVSILSRVNQSRVAKDRVLDFLASESIKRKESADIVSEVLARISATCAIGDKATTIESMLQLQNRFPHLELPIKLKPVETR